MREIYDAVSVKKSEVEILQDEVSHHKYEKSLIEGELENKKDEIQELTKRYKVLQRKEQYNKIELEKRIKILDEALKAKEKQLIDHLKRDRGIE